MACLLRQEVCSGISAGACPSLPYHFFCHQSGGHLLWLCHFQLSLWAQSLAPIALEAEHPRNGGLAKGSGQASPRLLCKPRQPYNPDFITKVSKKLDLHLPFDAAIYTCLSISFYSVAQVSEVTVLQLNAFDPMKHIMPANLQTSSNQDGAEVTMLHIPHTKAAPLKYEDIYWSCHPGPTDPYEDLVNHKQINRLGDSNHLFAYCHKGKLRPLTKYAFVRWVADTARAAGLDSLQGHEIWIGTTLFYLLRGTPFEAVKVMGRWSSDAFLRYLRKHAQILAPYIQANLDIHHSFSHFIMPSQATLQGQH